MNNTRYHYRFESDLCFASLLTWTQTHSQHLSGKRLRPCSCFLHFLIIICSFSLFLHVCLLPDMFALYFYMTIVLCIINTFCYVCLTLKRVALSVDTRTFQWMFRDFAYSQVTGIYTIFPPFNHVFSSFLFKFITPWFHMFTSKIMVTKRNVCEIRCWTVFLSLWTVFL